MQGSTGGATDEDLIFAVDGLGRLQAATDSVDTVAQWPVSMPSEGDLSTVGRQVLAAAQRLVLLSPSIAQDLKTLAARLAIQLPAVRFFLRTASPKRPTGTVEDPSWALKSLRHTQLVAQTVDGEELLVEPSFRAHFALPSASVTYATALAALPELLVLAPQAMRRLVQQLAARLAAEVALTGRSLPPWRTAPALLSKWLPVSYVDSPVQPSAYQPIHTISSFALTSGLDSPLSTSSNGSSTQSPMSASPNSVLPYQQPPVLTKATDLLSKLAPVQQQRAAPAPSVVVVGFAVRSDKSAPAVASLIPDAAPAATPVSVIVPASTPIAPSAVPAPAPPAVPVLAVAAGPTSAIKTTGLAIKAAAAVSAPAARPAVPTIIPPTVPATTKPAATPHAVSRDQDAADSLVAAVTASKCDASISMAGVAAAAAATVAAAKRSQPVGDGGGIMRMLQQQLSPRNSSSGSAGGAGSLTPRRSGLASKVSGGGSKVEGASAVVSKVAGTAVSKVAGVPRKSKLQAVYTMLLPRMHTVKFAGAPVIWEDVKAAASPRLCAL